LKEEIALKPIGTVHRRESDDDVRKEIKDTEAEIEIYPQYGEATEGLEGFSHVFVLGYFDRLKPEQKGLLKVRPRRLVGRGMKLEDLPLVGVFALDSPARPNPIGLSLVRLVRIEEGRRLVVSGLDFFDGTPVLDIKPYQAGYRADDYRLPHWLSELYRKSGMPSSQPI
jgi:tRNA (adenine37-N6)-methyltransferase